MKRLNKGFTLMELLIVIGVLGILAAGLLAAIDPFEQLKKARDTNNRSAAIEMLSSSQRYYATHGYLPWYKPGATAGSYDTAICPDANWSTIRPGTSSVTYPRAAVKVSLDLGASDGVYTCIDGTLGEDGEIKGTFFAGLKSPLYIMSGSPTSTAVCFSPEGKASRTDASTKYLLSGTSIYEGTDGTDICPDVTNDDCLQCFE